MAPTHKVVLVVGVFTVGQGKEDLIDSFNSIRYYLPFSSALCLVSATAAFSPVLLSARSVNCGGGSLIESEALVGRVYLRKRDPCFSDQVTHSLTLRD